MGHLIACEQDKTPQTIIRSLHLVPVSHTKCQPRARNVSMRVNSFLINNESLQIQV